MVAVVGPGDRQVVPAVDQPAVDQRVSVPAGIRQEHPDLRILERD
jgi:hypothetical protein